MLSRDNLIIRLVLLYRSKEKLAFEIKQIIPPFFLSDIQLSYIYLQLWKENKRILRVFLRKQERPVTYFCEKNKSIKLQTFS